MPPQVLIGVITLPVRGRTRGREAAIELEEA
jgi:hypothetical protein